MIIFFFNDTATTEIYTLSLHDALPISRRARARAAAGVQRPQRRRAGPRRHAHGRAPVDAAEHPDRVEDRDGADRARPVGPDRKSTRLNSSHANISYAVFCLKKKKINHM